MAIEKDSPADVQFLIENCQANVNATTYSGCTPLHTASGRGNIVIVAYLLSMGANPELLTDEGDSALDLAGSEQVCIKSVGYKIVIDVLKNCRLQNCDVLM